MDELSAERSAVVGGESMAFATPNMIGDLLVPSGGGRRFRARESDPGSAASTGLAVTVPTGPNGFAGADTTDSLNEVLLQPYDLGDHHFQPACTAGLTTASAGQPPCDNSTI